MTSDWSNAVSNQCFGLDYLKYQVCLIVYSFLDSQCLRFGCWIGLGV